MEYMEFLGRIRDLLNERYSDVTVSVHSTVKNNGVVLSGLSFSKKGYNASPTIYMENYYSDYVEGADHITRKNVLALWAQALNSADQAKDGFQIRRLAVENNVTVFTAADTVRVLLDVLEELTMPVSTIDA